MIISFTLGIILLVLLPAILIYHWISPQFGGKVSDDHILAYSKSEQWLEDKFENTSLTEMKLGIKPVRKLLAERYRNRNRLRPNQSFECPHFDSALWNDVGNDKPAFIWYGHSTALLKIKGVNLLIDPMFGPNAAPISPFPSKRFSNCILNQLDQFPVIDAVLLTHDHYDHLDMKSIEKLKSKVKHFYVALGVGRHLEKWGVDSGKIIEFDWWDEIAFDNIKLVFTPGRHFSGRGLFDRAKSIWGGWVIQSDNYNIYWSGDSGFDEHFKEVGKLYGPFDLGFMECGQYHKYWRPIHMFPEETVEASIDAQVNMAVPVHWGGFTLAVHPWDEPIEQFVHNAKIQKLNHLTPAIGEVVDLSKSIQQTYWWRNLK